MSLPQKLRALPLALWTRTTRRIRMASAFILFLYVSPPPTSSFPRPPACPAPTDPPSLLTLWLSTAGLVPAPRLSLEYARPYNASKLALLIENRPLPLLAPLLLHFISVVPPDWSFRFMGSLDSVALLNSSSAVQHQVATGKLDLTYIPANMSTGGQEMISRFLTNPWIYETVLRPAEWLLVFQTDSILCANSRLTLDDFLEYDWVGAPWRPSHRWGGNGGLSLRRVSAMLDVLRHQVRAEDSEPEDVWLAERVAHRPGARVANGSVALTFSGEQWDGEKVVVDDEAAVRRHGSLQVAAEAGEYIGEVDGWRHGFYEPMGYHTGGSGTHMHARIFGTPELRRHVWRYCPEVKMTLPMDAARFVPGECKARWGRDVTGEVEEEFGTEVVDGEEVPLLPPGLAMF